MLLKHCNDFKYDCQELLITSSIIKKYHAKENCHKIYIYIYINYIFLNVSDVLLTLNEEADSIQMMSTFQNDIESILLGKYTVKALYNIFSELILFE